MKRFQEGDQVFDGFAHRGFVESIDGWRNVVPDENEYAAVRQANAVLDLFTELREARIRIWELEKEVSRYKPLFDQATR
jgi:hypothetical protein